MSQLGDRLRALRENQGISLAQAAAETRILQRYLVALEDGDYRHLPGDVYARGFIRNYAYFLGVSAEELIELYRSERGLTEPIRIVPAMSAPRIRGCFVPSAFAIFFVMLALIGVGYLILSATNRIGENAQLAGSLQPGGASPSTPLPLPTQSAATPRATTATPAAGMTATPAPAGFQPFPPTPTIGPGSPIVLEVRVDSGSNPGSWLHIKTDDVSVFQKVLLPGQVLNYTAQRKLWIRAGNAGVVVVTINGQEQRLGTKSGEVVTFTWPP